MPREPAPEQFRVEIEGVDAGAFTAVEGLKARVEVVAYQDGDDPALRKRPGRTICDNVTLRKGRFTSPALWHWWSETRTGQFKPRTVTITLQDKRGAPVCRWQLHGCWPCEWEFAAHEADSDTPQAMLVEAITFVVESIDFVSEPGD